MNPETMNSIVQLVEHLIAPHMGVRNVVDMSGDGPTILKFLESKILCEYQDRYDMYEVRILVKTDQPEPRKTIRITHLISSELVKRSLKYDDINILAREINSTIKRSIKRMNDTELSKTLYE